MHLNTQIFVLRIVLLAGLMMGNSGYTQEIEHVVSKLARDSIIRNTAEMFQKHYVFPEKGMAIGKGLISQNEQGAFDGLENPHDFRSALQRTIRGIVDDKHVIVIYTGPPNKEDEKPMQERNSTLQQEFEQRKAVNFGIPELRIHEKNIGYLKVTKFTSPELFAPVMTAASEYLKNVDGLILDLRSRGGGNSYTVQLLLSYFLPPQVHLLNWHYRDTEEIEETWTLPFVGGNQFLDIPIVVLTSQKTFSGSEMFPYLLKHHERATIIGETTRGGAHTYKEMFPSEEFLVLVPYGRALSVRTQDNWEAKGVKPDWEIPQEKALEKALEILTEKIQKP